MCLVVLWESFSSPCRNRGNLIQIDMLDFIHSFNRRCKSHDYRSRCIYLITMLKSAAAPTFSSVTPIPGMPKLTPQVKLSNAGEIVHDCLDRLCIDYPALRLLNRIVMPDHIHFELFVTERTELTLGSMMAAFKASCTGKFRREFPYADFSIEKLPLFEKGFNDKIAFREGAKNAFYEYIADNPRRYLVKKLYPEYFFHKLIIEVNGKLCGLYGNIFLLDNPVKSCVRISRTPERTLDFEAKRRKWEETIRSGGVLVSPFINPREKDYRDVAIRNGNGIILIADYRFSDRKKPYKELFDQCADGRLLIVSTEDYEEAPKKMEYLHAQELNAIAARIAELQPHEVLLRSRQGTPR